MFPPNGILNVQSQAPFRPKSFLNGKVKLNNSAVDMCISALYEVIAGQS